jgi:hypothetical protein
MLVFVIVLTLSLISSKNANALTLDPVLNTINSITKIVRTDDANVAKNGQRSNNSENTSGSANTKNSSQQTPTQLPSLNTVDTPSGETFTAEPLSELPTIDASDMRQPTTIYTSRPIKAIAASTTIHNAKATDIVSPLQATDQGWKVFGMAWYWWLIGGAGVVFATRKVILVAMNRKAAYTAAN